MKKLKQIIFTLLSISCIVLSSCGSNKFDESRRLYTYYTDYFKIGAAFSSNAATTYGDDLAYEFNSMTCENEMKWDSLQPSRDSFNFAEADYLVNFAKKHNMKVRGHALVWYNATLPYIFTNKDGSTADKETLKATMKKHIQTVISHFGDETVYCWDVVNEALNDEDEEALEDRSNCYRGCKWYDILGEEYILLAFQYAKEIVDELGLNIKLYYNDYCLTNPYKRSKALAMLHYLLDNNCPIDGVGMQSHYHVGSFSMKEFETSIKEFSALGLDVQITEFDVSVYDETKNYDEWYDLELPESVEKIQTTIYDRAFEIMRKYKDNISSVSFWGVADDMTYLDQDETKKSCGHKNYPYIFDMDHNKKTSYYAIAQF